MKISEKNTIYYSWASVTTTQQFVNELTVPHVILQDVYVIGNHPNL